jgi:Ran GTPase-activating protein (RanGAP) involved in mRNA processing and transport
MDAEKVNSGHADENESMRVSHTKAVCGEAIDSIFNRIRVNDATMTELHLEGQNVGDKEAVKLAEALQSNTTLHELNLIGAGVVKALSRASLTSNTTLNMLDNSLYYIGRGSKIFTRFLKKGTSLQVLNRLKNMIRNDGAVAIGKALELNATLQTLDLSYNAISDLGAMALANALKSPTIALRELNLFNNAIGAKGATSLADALESNTTLRRLDLGLNTIGDTGAKALAQTLESNTSVELLDLRYGMIGDDGAKALAKALEMNTTLQKLDLSWNYVYATGAKALLVALQNHNGTLSALELNYQGISFSLGAITKQIDELVEKNALGTRSPLPRPKPRLAVPAQQSGLLRIDEADETALHESFERKMLASEEETLKNESPLAANDSTPQLLLCDIEMVGEIPLKLPPSDDQVPTSPKPRAAPPPSGLIPEVTPESQLQPVNILKDLTHHQMEGILIPSEAQSVPEEIMTVDSATTKDRLHSSSIKYAPSDEEGQRYYIDKKDITDHDVLCGQEIAGTDHPGNLMYYRLVEENKEAYQATRKREEKAAIRNSIIDKVLEHGRFVVETRDRRYYLRTESKVQKKVSTSLGKKK